MAASQKTWLGTTDGDWGTATNWDDGEVPEAGDDVIVPAGATVNIAGSSDDAVALASVTVEDGCSITIGTEGTPLEIDLADSGTFNFGGTGVCHIDCSGADAVYTITNASTGAATGSPGLYLVGGEAGSIVNINTDNDGAHIGLVTRNADAGTFSTINLENGMVTLGPVCSTATVNQSGGTVNATAPTITTWTQTAGTSTLGNSLAPTTVNLKGGEMNYNSTGTCTAMIIEDPGVLNCSANARTFTNTDIRGNEGTDGALNDVFKSITFTNPVSLSGAGLKALNRGTSMNAALTALS